MKNYSIYVQEDNQEQLKSHANQKPSCKTSCQKHILLDKSP